MKESKEIVHRAVLRAKGLDPDLVPSPQPSEHSPIGLPLKGKNRGRVNAHTDKDESDGIDGRIRGDSDTHGKHTSNVAKSNSKKNPQCDSFLLDDVELETLLPKSRGVVGGGGGGDFTRGVGATNYLRVQHEVQQQKVTRRVRLALVDPKYAPEVDAVDAASEMPIVLRSHSSRQKIDNAKSAYASRGLLSKRIAKTRNDKGNEWQADSTTTQNSSKQRVAPSIAYGFRKAGVKAKGAVLATHEKAHDPQHATPHRSQPDPEPVGPRDARLSASLRALVGNAPAHISAAVDAAALEKEKKAGSEVKVLQNRLKSLADKRNVLAEKNAKTFSVLEKAQAELRLVEQQFSEEQGSEQHLHARFLELRRTESELLDKRSIETKTAKSRNHLVDRLRAEVITLKQNTDATKDTLIDASFDLKACKEYSESAVQVEKKATESLEWIKSKYLSKANGWKRDLEEQKLITERVAEELRDLRAEKRRRMAKETNAEFVQDALLNSLVVSQDNVASDLQRTQTSEDTAKDKVLRLAVSIGLSNPSERTPDEIVKAVETRTEITLHALCAIDGLQVLEQSRIHAVNSLRDTLRRTRLGLAEGEDRCGRKSVFEDSNVLDEVDDDNAVATASAIHRTSIAPDRREGGEKRDLELSLRITNRALLRKFKVFKGLVSKLAAADEGLRKINQSVRRVTEKVNSSLNSVSEGKEENGARAASTPTSRRGRTSIVGRLPSSVGQSPTPRGSFSSIAAGRPPIASTRLSLAGRAAENQRRVSMSVTGSAHSSPRRPALVVAAASASALSKRGRPSSAFGGSTTSSSPTRRTSRVVSSAFDRLTVPSAIAELEPREPSSDWTEGNNAPGRDSSTGPSDAASVAMKVLSETLPETLEETCRVVYSVIVQLPAGKDGRRARESVMLGGARDKAGGLRGGAFLGDFGRSNLPGASTVSQESRSSGVMDNLKLHLLLCALPGKVPVAAGEVDDDPARMRLKRGRAYREMAMKWCFRAGRPIADEDDDDDELHTVAGSDGVLRFNGVEGGVGNGGGGGVLNGDGSIATHDGTHNTNGGGAIDLARNANVGLSADAFRRLVARTRKAKVVPTRAELKIASVRAHEKSLNRAELKRMELEE